jgi:hypothetical protein
MAALRNLAITAYAWPASPASALAYATTPVTIDDP